MSEPSSPPGQGAIHNRLFDFEADFSGDLRCLPMAVRRKLDLAGVKLKLVQWHGLSSAERESLLQWKDDMTSLVELREWLLMRSNNLPEGPAKPLQPARSCGWQEAGTLPEEVALSCDQLGLKIEPQRWANLDELQRFALIKLSHPGHEHRNLATALLEFRLLKDP
jgi:hypothetical protein